MITRISEFKDKVDWNEISKYQKLSDEFKEEFKYKLNKNTDFKLFENLSKTIIKTYTAEEFISEILNDDYKYQYKFLLKNEGGESSFKYYMYDDFRQTQKVLFFILFKDDEPVAMAHIAKSPYIENTWWLSYLSVDINFEGLGYASELADYIFNWFKENNLQFETSSYTTDGFLKLKPLFNKLSIKYDVKFIDKDKF